MTVFARFTEEFPDREETRIIHLFDKATKQRKMRLWLDERFCADPECDCQRMMIYAIDEHRATRAAICYEFTGRADRAFDGMNPFLEPYFEQPPGARKILEYVKNELERDAGYRQRLRDHYDEMKRVMRDPTHALWPAVLKDRRVMDGLAKNMVRELRKTAQPTPKVPARTRREKNRRKRLKKKQ